MKKILLHPPILLQPLLTINTNQHKKIHHHSPPSSASHNHKPPAALLFVLLHTPGSPHMLNACKLHNAKSSHSSSRTRRVRFSIPGGCCCRETKAKASHLTTRALSQVQKKTLAMHTLSREASSPTHVLTLHAPAGEVLRQSKRYVHSLPRPRQHVVFV